MCVHQIHAKFFKINCIAIVAYVVTLYIISILLGNPRKGIILSDAIKSMVQISMMYSELKRLGNPNPIIISKTFRIPKTFPHSWVP
jgi:hypothetical protein